MSEGATRFFARRRRERTVASDGMRRPFAPATIELARRIAEAVREHETIAKGKLTVLMGCGTGGMENALIYIAENEPHIAEDDGQFLWVGGEDD